MFLQRSNDPSPIWLWPSTNSPTLVELVPRGLFGKKYSQHILIANFYKIKSHSGNIDIIYQEQNILQEWQVLYQDQLYAGSQ